jgi:hypothetical protein
MCYEILDINLYLVKNYSSKVANNIDYFGCSYSEPVLIEENINVY